MTTNKCRAKDPSRCWKHGTQQGIIAHENITKLMSVSSPKYFLNEEQRASKPIKELSPSGLALALMDEVRKLPDVDETKIKEAILLASDLHKTDTRSNRGRYDSTAYIEHPLRNTLRSIRYYGTTSQTVIIGSLLHDTVEDHPFEISEKYFGVKAETEEEARSNSFKYIEQQFGPEVYAMVKGMSNPITPKYMPSHEKNAIYAQHVGEAIEDKNVCIGKVADFVDNAVGLHHNLKGGMAKESIRRRAVKYLPVCDILSSRLKRDEEENELPVSREGLQTMLTQLESGRKSLLKLAVL